MLSSPLGKKCDPSLEQNCIPFTQEWFLQSLVEIGPLDSYGGRDVIINNAFDIEKRYTDIISLELIDQFKQSITRQEAHGQHCSPEPKSLAINNIKKKIIILAFDLETNIKLTTKNSSCYLNISSFAI